MNGMTFTERLKAAIEGDPELTEAGLAKMASLDASTIRQMIIKNRSPRMATAQKICAALGTTVEQFMLDDPLPVDRDIARLASQLTDEHRRRLLAYGEGLLDAQG
jgi:transcriptional regulator with XRE-family HTH domain